MGALGGELGRPLNSQCDVLLDGSLTVGYARVLELRKLNGSRRVPRLSVRASDASSCSAVVVPLVARDGRWAPSASAPLLVPVLSLGRRVAATEGSGPHRGAFTITAAPTAAGGPLLRATSLSPDLFEAAVMRAVHKDLMKMIVVELKQELEARAEPKTGSKAWLRRRLHAAIVREHLDASEQ